MDATYHGSRRKGLIEFEEWSREVRAGIPKEESEWVKDDQLRQLYEGGMLVIEAWHEVGWMFEKTRT